MKKDFEKLKVNITCPNCKKFLSEIWVAKLDSVIGVRYAYICIKCKNLIKVSDEKYLNTSRSNTSTVTN